MKNIALRALSGGIYVAIIVAGILLGPVTCLLLLFVLGALGVNEFLTITGHETGAENPVATMRNNLLIRSLDCAGAMVLIMTVWFSPLPLTAGIACWILYLILRLCMQLWITDRNAITSLSLSLMSQLYVALPIALMGSVFHISPLLLLLLFVLVWINDTFAFLSGCTLGRHKLFERISPKKSWEGFVGGALFTVGASILAGWLLPTHFFSPLIMGGLGLVVTIAATLGDLIESMIKRTLGVKDSGTLIPGHGGILDRIDSLLLVIPASFVYFLLVFFN